MRKVELMLAGAEPAQRIALTAFLPDTRSVSGCVVFASPGGGYGRGYYDMHFDGYQGYSQAEHHVTRGHVVIAYDHLGVGDSSTDGLATMTIEDIAAANHAAVAECAARIRSGTLDAGFPAVPRAACIGIGQSMGGGVSIIMQANHASFDAIGVLGYSAIHTVLPQRTREDVERGIAIYDVGRDTAVETLSLERSSAQVADFVYPFHWEDVPRDILDADMAEGYPIRRTAPAFGSLTIPNCAIGMMAPRYVERDAAAIDVPVFIGLGERDTSPDPRLEPSAYRAARDTSLFIVPRMAHMHNFASTRQLLWDRLSDWMLMVARGGRTGKL